MYAVFGLGNPDKEYDKTRHNIGFDVIDELASQMGVEVKTKRHKALCGIGNIGGEKVILVKPQTYMNLSGESVRAVSISLIRRMTLLLFLTILIWLREELELEPRAAQAVIMV